MIEELRAFLLARYEDEERRTVIPAAFTVATWMSGSDRTRLLADLKAKRAIVDNHFARFRAGGELHDAQTLRLFAEQFANHPDYRSEWRP